MEGFDKRIDPSILAGFNDIPSPKPKAKAKSTKKKMLIDSNFLITINSNRAPSKLRKDPSLQMKTADDLYKFSDLMFDEFRAGKLLIPKGGKAIDGWAPPPLIHHETQLELAPNKKMLHTHNLVKFSGQCYIDVIALRARATEFFGNKIHINVKFYADSQKAREMYINKNANGHDASKDYEEESKEPSAPAPPNSPRDNQQQPEEPRHAIEPRIRRRLFVSN
jgi:hypothetical protein